MLITPIKNHTTQYNPKIQVKPQVWAQRGAEDNSLRYNEIPSIAFKGMNRIIELPLEVQFHKNAGYKIHLTQIKDLKNKLTADAFLAYTKYSSFQNTSVYKLFDKESKFLGECTTDFSEEVIDKKSYTKLTNFYTTTRENYSGCGSKLIQAAVEKSLEAGDGGRIKLNAYNIEDEKNDPFIFYYKKGLSLISPNGDAPDLVEYLDNAVYRYKIPEKKIMEYAEKLLGKKYSKLNADEQLFSVYKAVSEETGLNLDEIRLGFGEAMYLKDDAVKNFWLPIIKANPIFSDSNKL